MAVAAPYSLDVILETDDTCTVSWRAGEDYTDTQVYWGKTAASLSYSGSLGAQDEGESADYFITDTFDANTDYIVGVYGYANGDSDYREKVVARYVDTDEDTLAIDDSSADDFVKSDSGSDTLALTESTQVGGSIALTAEDTVRVVDNVVAIAALSEDADYQYYFGDYNGKIYAESYDYTSDDGTEIESYLLTKETDLADQAEESLDAWKTIYFVRLWYVDRYLDTTVIIGVSTDGGITWTEKGKSIGNGDNTMKSQDFWFHKTGQIFKFRVRNVTTTDRFQWAALEVYYTISGDYFVL